MTPWPQTAQRNGFPRDKMLGWWAGSEKHDSSGDAAKGYTAMTFNTPANPVLDDIRKKLYASARQPVRHRASAPSTICRRDGRHLWWKRSAWRRKNWQGQTDHGEQMRLPET